MNGSGDESIDRRGRHTLQLHRLELPFPIQRSQGPTSPSPSALPKCQQPHHSKQCTSRTTGLMPRRAALPPARSTSRSTHGASSSFLLRRHLKEERRQTQGQRWEMDKATHAPPQCCATFFFLEPRLRSRSDQQSPRSTMPTS